MKCYSCLDQRGAGPENRRAERLLLEMEVEDLTVDGRQGIRRRKVECKHHEMPLESNQHITEISTKPENAVLPILLILIKPVFL